MPFMVRSVMAVFGSVVSRTLDEGAASLRGIAMARFRDVIVPNAVPGILAGSLMVVTLSLGEFQPDLDAAHAIDQTLPDRPCRQLRVDAAEVASAIRWFSLS